MGLKFKGNFWCKLPKFNIFSDNIFHTILNVSSFPLTFSFFLGIFPKNSPIEIKPILQEANLSNNMPALQADFKVGLNAIWEAERVKFFDSRIINADAPSYVTPPTIPVTRQEIIKTGNNLNQAVI